MRQSRKAGLLSKPGLPWFKYECEISEEQVDNPIVSDWVSVGGGGIDGEYSATGRQDWWLSTSPYRFYLSGKTVTISESNPGTVYNVNSDGTILTRTTVGVSSSGAWSETYRKTITHRYEWVTVYTPGNLIGVVRTADGKLPNENNGYTYVTTYKGYTIMEERQGDYYAYTTTLPTINVPTYNFSAKIEDGVLVVTGDGSATIVDDVLVVTGGGSASVENNTLYVR